MIFGFALTVCLIPGIMGAGTTSRWALASVLLPIMLCWVSRSGVAAERTTPLEQPTGPRVESWDLRPGPRGFTTAHLFGLLFIWYAAISLSWSAGQYEGLDALVKLIVIACAFVYGSKLESLKPVIIGFGLGIWVNSVVMLFGIDVPNAGPGSGMFVNSNSMGEIAGLVLVAAIFYKHEWTVPESESSGAGYLKPDVAGFKGEREQDSWRKVTNDTLRTVGWNPTSPCPLWWLIPGILPAFIMANCRGAFVAVAGACVWWLWRRSRLSAFGLVASALLIVATLGGGLTSVNMRLEMWRDILPQLTFMGHGLGSFYMLFPLSATMDTLAMRPEHLHNDWIEYGFECGLGAAFLFGFLWLTRSIMLACLIIEACFGFPTHMAATAILGGIVAGHDTRHHAHLRDSLIAWRISLRAWLQRASGKPSHRGITTG